MANDRDDLIDKIDAYATASPAERFENALRSEAIWAIDALVAEARAESAAEEQERIGEEVLMQVKADAWDEGFDAGERDAMEHETFDEPCITNPYRQETPDDE